MHRPRLAIWPCTSTSVRGAVLRFAPLWPGVAGQETIWGEDSKPPGGRGTQRPGHGRAGTRRERSRAPELGGGRGWGRQRGRKRQRRSCGPGPTTNLLDLVVGIVCRTLPFGPSDVRMTSSSAMHCSASSAKIRHLALLSMMRDSDVSSARSCAILHLATWYRSQPRWPRCAIRSCHRGCGWPHYW